jgi:hypothetical protein
MLGRFDAGHHQNCYVPDRTPFEAARNVLTNT